MHVTQQEQKRKWDRRMNVRGRMGGWGKTGRLDRKVYMRRGLEPPTPSSYENVKRESVVLHTNFKINKGQLNGSACKGACGLRPIT